MKFRDIYNPLNYVKNTELYIDYLLDHFDQDVKDGYADLNPTFQRGHKWTIEQQEMFMGHLLTGGMVQPFIFSILGNPDTGLQILVDGKQRLQAIRLWVCGKIHAETVDGLRFKIHDIEDAKTLLRHVSIRVGYVHLDQDAEKAWKKTLQLYIKLNSGGTPHTKEEIDHVKRML